MQSYSSPIRQRKLAISIPFHLFRKRNKNSKSGVKMGQVGAHRREKGGGSVA
jgi:hypothetical protein